MKVTDTDLQESPQSLSVKSLRYRGQSGETALAVLGQDARQMGVAKALAEADGEFAIRWSDACGVTHFAVDRFAVRPLCWRVIGGVLHLSQRADELAALEPKADLDPQALFEYLYFHVIPSPRTIFRGIHRLPPGQFATFAGGEVQTGSYWTPSFRPTSQPSFSILAHDFRTRLEKSVARQIEGAAMRPACFLSGGTDSSTVAGMIQSVTGQGPRAYSIGFEADGYDEMAYARIAARHFGCEHREYYVTPADLVAGMPRLARHFDQPFGNSSALPAYYCASRAREDGVDAILAGDGGDELFGGNSRYAKQGVFDLYAKVPRPLRLLLEPVVNAQALQGLALVRKAASYVQQARVPMPGRMELYNLLLRIGPQQIMEPEWLRQIDLHAPLAQQDEVWQMAVTESPLNRNLAFDWRYTLAECDVPKVVGSASMAGVQARFPFLDRELVEFSMSLPPAYKLKGQQLRWFFKEALRDFLPSEIINKQKHGFGLPFGVWCLRDAALRKLAEDSLQSIALRGFVRPAFVRELLTTLLPAHPGYYGELVWILCMLELWLQQVRPGYRMA